MKATLKNRWLRWIGKSLGLTAGDNMVTTPLLVLLANFVEVDSPSGMLAVWAVGNFPYLSYKLGAHFIQGGAGDV